MFTRICLLTGILVAVTLCSFSQSITNYSLTPNSNTFTALSGGTVPPGTGTGTVDEGIWNAIPIGFNFWYMGTRYTTVSASTNGWLTLGANITTPTPVNNLSSGGAPRPVLAPLWDNLNIQNGLNVTYHTTGAVGSRVFTLQFLNYGWSAAASGNSISLQVKLFEGSGGIAYIYRQESGSLVSASASIGITAAGTGSGNFLSLNGTGSTPVASATTETTTLGSKPATGQTYTFLPPTPAAPTMLSFTAVGATTTTLNWIDNATNERAYLVYRSTDGVNYTFQSQLGANSTSSGQAGLTGNTTYYWRVYALSEGAHSTPLGGSRTTACTPPAVPTVSSPVTYCLDATASPLTATGSNLSWGGSSASGTAGGNTTLTTPIYVDAPNAGNNRKTNFTTTTANVYLTTVSYNIPAWQNVNGLVLALFNSTGTVVATSATSTSQTAGSTAVQISNTFNYLIPTAGNYSIGIASGIGNIGSDNPSFPITEATGTINITGVSVAGYRCFNNIRFTTGSGTGTAPTPVTTTTGSTSYQVTQTVGGCVSAAATITVNVTSPNISQVPVTALVGNYPFSGNANDASGNNDGTLHQAPSLAADRFGINNKSYTFNGSSQYMSTEIAYTNPGNFTIATWFKTSSTTGGKLIGFGNAKTGSSSQYDRHIYMNNAGQLLFGVYPGTVVTVSSAQSYNDNAWHHVTATLSPTTGMALYVDGVLVGVNTTTTSGESYTGYWKIGYDNLNGWTSQPSSYYFNGALDDVLIYQRVLSSNEIATLFNSPDGAGNSGPVCTGASVSLNATSLGGATYAWSGPNSFTSTQQNPSLPFSAAATGVYTLKVTAGGCTSTAYTNITAATGNAGQWTGNVSTDWSVGGNWCSGSTPTATSDVIIFSTATRMPTISSSVACKNLSVNAGATLTITAAGVLNIAGNLTNNGTVNNNGTANFNGTTGQQTFSGVNNFTNLTLTNTAGLLLNDSIRISNHLLLVSGNLIVNNFNITVNGNFTNNSSASAFIPGNAAIFFGGSAAQVIGGTYTTTFNDVVITKTGSGVSLANQISLLGNLSVAAGTMNLGAFTANRNIAGGILTVSNNARLIIGGSNTFPINYTNNNLVVASTVEYAGTNQTVANLVYGNLYLSSSSGVAIKTLPGTALSILGNLETNTGAGSGVTVTAAAAISVNGNVTIGSATTLNGGNDSHTIWGNWTNNGTFQGNSGTIVFSGTGAMVGGTGVHNFNHLIIAASQVIFSNSTIHLSGSLATTGSGSFSQGASGTLVMTGVNTLISGSGIAINNLTVSGTVTTAESILITGNLTISGSLTATAGTITLGGTSKTISGAGSKNFYSLATNGSINTDANFSIQSTLTVGGSLTATAGTATFTGTSILSGAANLYNTTINGSSLQLSANSTLGVAGVLTISAGVLNTTASSPNTVNFNGTGAQSINALPYNNLVLSNGGNKTAANAITINNNITIGAGTTFTGGAYTHAAYGDWINNGNFVPGTGTVQFSGTQNSTIIGATTFYTLTIDHTSTGTALILENDVTAHTVNMNLGRILTGTHVLTITDTRNGSGIIFGNIQRNHAYANGIAYAFESPENTVTFNNPVGVSSVTVSVQKGSIGDFPFGGSISRLYTIGVITGTYTSATLRLHYEEDELNGNVESSMALWQNSGATWNAKGKSSNNTSTNYVEYTGITDIANRWTCSDNSNVVQWNGSLSSDWNTAANWTILQGSASRPPAASDIVNLGTSAFIHQPAINTNVSVKNIVFGSVQAVTLSLTAGGALTTGDVHGSWNTNAIHNINAGNQSITLHGNLELSDGVTGHLINLQLGTGVITIEGSLKQSGGAAITFTGAGNLAIGKDYLYTSGVFTKGTGTVTYNGTVNQTVGAVDYHHLVVNKAAANTYINQTLQVTGNVTVMAGQLHNSGVLTVTGNVTITNGSVLHNHSILKVGGNWNNSGTYIGDGAITNVIFNGTGTQEISATTFNNIEINKPVGSIARLTGDVTLKGNLLGSSGTLDIQSHFFNRDVNGGSATMLDDATLIIGANNAPNKFTNYLIGTGSTIIFNGTAIQHLMLPGLVYGNLVFRNTGQKILHTALVVNGDLTIENGATFDGGSNTISIGGHWTNQGIFVPGTSEVVCLGTGKNVTGNTTFNKLTVLGSYVFLNDMTFNGLLTITGTGSLTGGPSIHTTLHSDLINSGVLYTLGTTTFSGNVKQTLSLINAVQTVAITVNFNGTVSPVLNSTSVPQFGFLNINNTAGVNPSVGWTVLYALTIGNGGLFNGGISTHTIYGHLTNNGTITSSGNLNFTPSTPANLYLGTNFNSTGTVVFGGTGAISLSGTPAAFQHILITNQHVAGITPSSGWNMENLTINTGAILNAGNFTHSVNGNIVNNGSINSGNSTFSFTGTGSSQIHSASAFHHLTMNKTAAVATITSDITVNGQLNFLGGNLQTGSKALLMPSTATITNAGQITGWVNGRLQKAIVTGAPVKTFEVGDANWYTPLTITFNNVSSGGNLVASTNPGDHPQINASTINAGKNVNRSWTLVNDAIAYTSYSAEFNYPAGDIDAGALTGAFGISRFNGSSWTAATTSVKGATNTTATAITATGDFAIGEICNANTSISYAAPAFCTNGGTATVILTGNNGGTFSSDPGLAIDGNSGAVNLASSFAGSYQVTYTQQATTGCPVFVTSTTLQVSAASAATIQYAGTPYCSGNGIASVSFTGKSGGKYSAPNGLVIDSLTGAIQLGTSVAGTYTVTYGLPAIAGCNAFLTAADITITTQPSVTGTYQGNPYCANGGIAFPTGTFTGALGTLSSTAGLSIDPATGVVNLVASTPGSYTVVYTVPASGGCAIYTNNSTIDIVAPGTWTGAVNNEWNESGNWLCGQIPNHLTAVKINSGFTIYPAVVNTSAGKDINIQNGGVLLINGGTLQIAGNINNAGTLDATGGTIAMNGIVPQYLPANAFTNNRIQHLLINNNVTLGGQYVISESLTIGAGNITFATGNYLTLASGAAGTARLAALPVDGSGNATSYITGNVTIERYIPARRSWRLLTSPLSNTASVFNSWQNSGNYVPGRGILISGPNPQPSNGLDASNNNTASMKTFNAVTQNFSNITNTTTTLLSGNGSNAANIGYFVFVRGDRDANNFYAPNTNATTLRSNGTLQTGRQTLLASPVFGHYTIMGNPYAAPVNFTLANRTHLLKRFYAWDPNINSVGAYVALDDMDGDGIYSKSVPSSMQDNFLQSGQAFFVITDTAGPASLSFEESSKSNASTNVGFRPMGFAKSMEITLNLVEPSNAVSVADAAIAEFDDIYCTCVDIQDAVKFTNTNETFSFYRNGVSLAMERRQGILSSDTLFLKLAQTTQRAYQLVIKSNHLSHPGLVARVEDKFTGQSIPVDLEGITILNFSVTAAALSKDAYRFQIVFGNPVVLPVTFTSITAEPVANHNRVQWKVEHQQNLLHYTVEKATDGIHFTGVAQLQVKESADNKAAYQWLDKSAASGDNYYRIRNVDLDGKSALSKVVRVSNEEPGNIIVFPNPVIDGIIAIQLKQQPAGKYMARLTNHLGQQFFLKKWMHPGGNATSNFSLPALVTKGNYQLEVTGTRQHKTVIKVTIQ